ncbi:MAG: hypothetical protein ACI8W7_002257, partial [Gammaproteobacteria bacterium]
RLWAWLVRVLLEEVMLDLSGNPELSRSRHLTARDNVKRL